MLWALGRTGTLYRIPAQTVADGTTWTVVPPNWNAGSGSGLAIIDDTLIFPLQNAIYTSDIAALEMRVQQGAQLSWQTDAPKLHRVDGCGNCALKRVLLTNGTEVGVLFPASGESTVYLVRICSLSR